MDQNPSNSLNQSYDEVGQPSTAGTRVAMDRSSYNTSGEACAYEEPILSIATEFKEKQEPKTNRCFVGVLAAVFISLLTAFLVAVVVLAISAHLQVGDLQSEVQQLKNQLNQTMAELNTVQSNLQSSMDAFQNSSATAQLSSLQSEVQQLKNQLNQTMAELNTVQRDLTQMGNLQSSMDAFENFSATAQLSSLQSSVDTLTTRVNSPVNLYQNCSQETRSCDVDTPSNATYRKYCYTPLIPITHSVSTNYYYD